MMNSITWLTQKDMAKRLGVCVNTFKTYYRPKYPPSAQRGNKVYWTLENAQRIEQEINGTTVS
ncbi:hypothetical protein LP123_04590 [Moraxella bovis]|uniref:DNA-binding protein n=1 Tax=Moraxella bovis TaxID=476 RepID=A0AAQ2Q8B5_MORBO|nr:hypothetical protein [Moraxella bovis]AWY19853.1 hypothetical protein DQF64_04650 [Moraxella bovis]UYZ75023.1 hypothetical protein LP093_09650 [Moraxella bovis]UYZ79046.1 hypothetical protein LP115_04200 [Moraxella bovis]UYZ80367.1 hypothetical protein LP113_10015 [Moraxella bovis]UYZ87528.1 hypothetical protein LP094_04215 [Moraxella bovis]